MRLVYNSTTDTLFQTSCSIFNTTFNPQRLRLGNKILRQRLRGPAVAAYYPPRIGTIKDLRQAYRGKGEFGGWEVRDEDEDYRLEKIRVAKMRGKGAPKKKRSAAGTYNLVIRRGEFADWARREQEVDEEETGWEQVMDGSKTLGLFGLHCTALLAGWIDGQRKGLVLLMESSTWARNRMQGFAEGVNHRLCLHTNDHFTFFQIGEQYNMEARNQHVGIDNDASWTTRSCM